MLVWKLVHILGALGFLAAHGATVAVAFRLRAERDPARVRALLDLSRATRPWTWGSLVVLLVGGVVGGFTPGAPGSWWSEGWIWAALILLAALVLAAIPLAVPFYARVRRAVAEGSEAPTEDLGRLLGSSRPVAIAATETAGIVAIVWLMVFKPF